MLGIESESKRCRLYVSLLIGFVLLTSFASFLVSPYLASGGAIVSTDGQVSGVTSAGSSNPSLRVDTAAIARERESTRRYCFDRIRKELLEHVLSVVSKDRQFATLWLAYQALDIEGDFIELGVAKGGMTIVMKSLLVCTKDTRKHWMADSWQGLPKESEITAEFQGKDYSSEKKLHAGQFVFKFDMFKANLANWKQYWEKDGYTWPDDDPQILRGLFHDAVPKAPLKKLAFARCDGDIYSSTYECLEYTYPLLSCGGYVYIDDYWEFEECEKAVRDYTNKHELNYDLYTIHPEGYITMFYGMTGKKPAQHVEAAFWKKKCG